MPAKSIQIWPIIGMSRSKALSLLIRNQGYLVSILVFANANVKIAVETKQIEGPGGVSR